MSHPVYHFAEASATTKGFVGLVIDAQSHATVYRTRNAYPCVAWAILAAQREWEGRGAKLAQAAGIVGVAA